jgi:tRNA (guanine26-N2/guanine27-N2)-dimethyltransferase
VENLLFTFATERVTEGVVSAVVPRLKTFQRKPSDYAPSKAPVFYNPVMELNRDLAVLAVQAFQRIGGGSVSICEPLSGCGIRAIRLASEVDGVKDVVANDISEEAYKMTRNNVKINGLLGKVKVENQDANLLLSRYAAPKKRFNCVDLDPFGSPVPYMDSALRALRRGGLLALTATDMAPLCGVHPRACLRKYGGYPLRTEYCHELAVRLLAAASARSAAKHDIGLEVLFSYSSEHYIRLYSRADYGAKKADASMQNLGYVTHCHACLHRAIVKGFVNCVSLCCPECGSKMRVGGPLWIGRIVDESFVTSMQQEAKAKAFRLKKKISKLLVLVKSETDAPMTYFVIDKFCDKLGLQVPPNRFVVEKLHDAERKVYPTHFDAHGIKTDASASEVRKAIVASSKKTTRTARKLRKT